MLFIDIKDDVNGFDWEDALIEFIMELDFVKNKQLLITFDKKCPHIDEIVIYVSEYVDGDEHLIVSQLRDRIEIIKDKIKYLTKNNLN